MLHVTSKRVRFTAREFERIVRADLFGTHRLELIDGRIFRTAPQGDPHQFGIGKVNRMLSRLVPENEMLSVPGTLWLDRFTVVDPDIMWTAIPIGTPEASRPLPLLLVEVSFSTYKKDSGIKMRAYAKAGIRDYWIVNVDAKFVEVYRDPQPSAESPKDARYASVTRYVAGESIALLERPTISLAVDDLLP